MLQMKKVKRDRLLVQELWASRSTRSDRQEYRQQNGKWNKPTTTELAEALGNPVKMPTQS
jgi:hypothetical protein